MIYQFLILCLAIIFVILFIYIFAKIIVENDMKSYDVLLPIKGNGENMNNCLPNCIRGVCKKNNLNIYNQEQEEDSNSCKFDFQCQYCQDKKTNMFYVDFNSEHEKEILPLYEEEDLNLVQQNELNKQIEQNNEYINELNKRIKNMNSIQ